MEKGPFRVQTRESAKPLVRSEEQPQQERIVEAMPRTGYSRQQLADQTPPKSGRRFAIGAIIALLLILVVGGVAAFMLQGSTKAGMGSLIDSNKYQAVFFTNGQVYFGKLKAANEDTLRLTDVFYLQTENQSTENKENPQATSSEDSGNSVQLIKLGDEIHGPEDEMAINKDQVLFYENIKDNSKVAQSISKYKSAR